MKVRTESFRCDLCGKFRSTGVTETRPNTPDGEVGDGATETTVCAPCVSKASHVLAAAGVEDAS